MHTPGPWMYGRTKQIAGVKVERGWYIGPQDGERQLLDIGHVHLTSSQDEAVQGANARLIAAAPDLLAALKALVEEWDRHGCCDSRSVVDAARREIAKAEGQS